MSTLNYYIPTYRVSLVRDGSVRGDAPRPVTKTPESLAVILGSGVIPDDGREHFGIAMLDVRHRLIGLHEVSVGCLTSSLVHPREVFCPAVTSKAAAIVLYHNHPSGDPEPSAEDGALTQRLVQGGMLLGIEVLDHIVLGDGRYVSFKQRGRI